MCGFELHDKVGKTSFDLITLFWALGTVQTWGWGSPLLGDLDRGGLAPPAQKGPRLRQDNMGVTGPGMCRGNQRVEMEVSQSESLPGRCRYAADPFPCPCTGVRQWWGLGYKGFFAGITHK